MSELQAAYRTRRTEHQEQATVIEWARMHAGRWPELDLIFAIPNGASLAGGARAANKLKAEGMLPGVPDLCLPCARGGFHGLFIEMKVGRNRPSDRQTAMLDRLHREGFQALACWGAGETIAAIQGYLESGEMSY